MRETILIKRFVVGPLATNCYVVSGDSSRKGVLIDPGTFVKAAADYINARGIEIIATLNTHGDPDHVAGNAEFGYPVYIHELDAPYLSSPLPAKLLKDGDVIDLGDFQMEIIHTPGHTPGGISLRCDGVLFSGDTLFFEGVGRTDRPGGDREAIVRSIREKLMSLPNSVRVYPGHGPETTIEHEKRNNPFL